MNNIRKYLDDSDYTIVTMDSGMEKSRDPIPESVAFSWKHCKAFAARHDIIFNIRLSSTNTNDFDNGSLFMEALFWPNQGWSKISWADSDEELLPLLVPPAHVLGHNFYLQTRSPVHSRHVWDYIINASYNVIIDMSFWVCNIENIPGLIVDGSGLATQEV